LSDYHSRMKRAAVQDWDFHSASALCTACYSTFKKSGVSAVSASAIDITCLWKLIMYM